MASTSGKPFIGLPGQDLEIVDLAHFSASFFKEFRAQPLRRHHDGDVIPLLVLEMPGAARDKKRGIVLPAPKVPEYRMTVLPLEPLFALPGIVVRAWRDFVNRRPVHQ